MRVVRFLAVAITISAFFANGFDDNKGLTNASLAVILDIPGNENIVSIFQHKDTLPSGLTAMTEMLADALLDSSYPIITSTSLLNNIAWAHLAASAVESAPLQEKIIKQLGQGVASRLLSLGKAINALQRLHEINEKTFQWLEDNARQATDDMHNLANAAHITKQTIAELSKVIEKIEPQLDAMALEYGLDKALYSAEQHSVIVYDESLPYVGYAYAVSVWQNFIKEQWIIKEIVPGTVLLIPQGLKVTYQQYLKFDELPKPERSRTFAQSMLFRVHKKAGTKAEISAKVAQALLAIFGRQTSAAWSIYLVGHGTSITDKYSRASFAGLNEHDMAALLNGFNRLNVKFLYMDTCFAANESLRGIAYMVEHMPQDFLEPYGLSTTNFTLAIGGFSENIIFSQGNEPFLWLRGFSFPEGTSLNRFFGSTYDRFGSSLHYFSEALRHIHLPILSHDRPDEIGFERIIKRLLVLYHNLLPEVSQIDDTLIPQWKRVEAFFTLLEKALALKKQKNEMIIEQNINWPMIRLARLDYFQLATSEKDEVQQLSRICTQQIPEQSVVTFNQPLVVLRATDMPFTVQIEPEVDIIASGALQPTVYHFKNVITPLGLYQLVHKFTTGAIGPEPKRNADDVIDEESHVVTTKLESVDTRTPTLFVIDRLTSSLTALPFENVIIAINWPSSEASKKFAPFVSYETVKNRERRIGYLTSTRASDYDKYMYPFATEELYQPLLEKAQEHPEVKLIDQVLAAINKGSIANGSLG